MTDERLAEIEKIYAKMRKDCKTWNTEHIYADQLLAFDDLIAALRAERQKVAELTSAIERIQIGGNSLPQIFGIPHPPDTATYDEAREFFHEQGNEHWVMQYESWLCWKTIRDESKFVDSE